MQKHIVAFTSDVRYCREDGQWVVEAASTPATEQCNSWVDETGNVIVDVDTAFSIKDSLDNMHSVRYMHIIVTYVSLADWVKMEVLLRRMALAGQGFDEAMPAELRELVEASISSFEKKTKETPPEQEEKEKEKKLEKPAADNTISVEELKGKLKGKK